jgi:putative endonuclease
MVGYKYIMTNKRLGVLYLGVTNNITTAIQREKQIKEWKREWKIKLIEALNPQWHDLAQTLNC